ncbi:hypothetical protein [Corallococcus exercitus]|uniref:Uncharacterized protein n=1 Tax=Corallococcus exercitus TaxID=2316736 RepID=A0A7Y4JNE6_9BACT|nr:hypothetical protein [Corallococcus exercitus]NOK08239.1 hypothetical protein [Corallococcus exercitus]
MRKVDDVERFAAAAQRAGWADPSKVDDALQLGITASLAGDHASARAIFRALLIPMSDGDIDLGQDELAQEVLSVDLHDCATRYLAAVYMTTPVAARADALVAALDEANGLSYFSDPIKELQAALGGTLPDLEAFLPAWIARIERDAKPVSPWESQKERWLRAAIGRRDGVAGLERVARTARHPEAVQAWCDAVKAAGDGTKTLRAYETGAALVTCVGWRGGFLDGAALAAQVLGRKDAHTKLKAAWLGAPSLTRLLRWLLAGEPTSATFRKRAASALKASPTKAPRLVGFLEVLVGDLESAARRLARAPGIGWSSSDHPGHLLFPVFAWLLGGTPKGSVRAGLAQALVQPPSPDEDTGFELLDEVGPAQDAGPRLVTPSVIDALQRAEVTQRLTVHERGVALAAMKAAATKRTEGVLGTKRRRHYGHAAALVACCVELEDGTRGAAGTSTWAEALRARTSRFPAFQEALHAPLARARRGAGPMDAPDTGVHHAALKAGRTWTEPQEDDT